MSDVVRFLTNADNYTAVGLNLLATFIWVVAGAMLYRWAFLPLRRSRTALSRLLPFSRDQITICHGILPPRPGYVYYTVEEGDLAGINHINTGLVGAYGSKRICTVNFHAAELRLGQIPNLLCISGPRWNRVTELMIGRLGSPISFDKTDSLVLKRRDGSQREYRAVRRSNGDEQTCYGFVCGGHIRTAAGKRQYVVICAGLNTLSTYGSVVFLMSLSEAYSFRNYREIRPRLLGKRWGIVLRVENTSNPNTSGPVRTPLDPEHITIDIVDVLPEAEFRAPFVYRY